MQRNVKPVLNRNIAPKDFQVLMKGSEGVARVDAKKGGIIDNAINRPKRESVPKLKVLNSIKEDSIPPRGELPVKNSEGLPGLPTFPSDSKRGFVITPPPSDNEDELGGDIYSGEAMGIKGRQAPSEVDDDGDSYDGKVSLNMNGFVNDMRDFPEFSSFLTNTYWGPMTQNSTTLDIIAVYLKGQKILYIDSKNYCETKLNTLMMPTIFISAVCTVISVVLKDMAFGPILVSALTGISTFILSVISYLKLDAKAEAHKTTAYQFDKLQTMTEFFSGKVLLIKDKDISKNVQKFVEDVEKKVEEIKDTNQFIIPATIRYRYPNIYSTNVFSEIKKYKIEEKMLKNELYIVARKLDELPENAPDSIKEDLRNQKEIILREILKQKTQSFNVDKQFNGEINDYVARQVASNNKGCLCFRKKEVQVPQVKSLTTLLQEAKTQPSTPPSSQTPTAAPTPAKTPAPTSASIQNKLVPPTPQKVGGKQ